MDLPTYTNIWRIEKKLYKLYDFRLPQPVSVVYIGVVVGVGFVWVMLLRLLGVPLEMPFHVVYIVPPFVIAFLATRPVIEGKRLSELIVSQARFLAEPRVYTRLRPEHEPGAVEVTVRVWHRHPEAGPLPRVVGAAEPVRERARERGRGPAREAQPQRRHGLEPQRRTAEQAPSLADALPAAPQRLPLAQQPGPEPLWDTGAAAGQEHALPVDEFAAGSGHGRHGYSHRGHGYSAAPEPQEPPRQEAQERVRAFSGREADDVGDGARDTRSGERAGDHGPFQRSADPGAGVAEAPAPGAGRDEWGRDTGALWPDGDSEASIGASASVVAFEGEQRDREPGEQGPDAGDAWDGERADEVREHAAETENHPAEPLPETGHEPADADAARAASSHAESEPPDLRREWEWDYGHERETPRRGVGVRLLNYFGFALHKAPDRDESREQQGDAPTSGGRGRSSRYRGPDSGPIPGAARTPSQLADHLAAAEGRDSRERGDRLQAAEGRPVRERGDAGAAARGRAEAAPAAPEQRRRASAQGEPAAPADIWEQRPRKAPWESAPTADTGVGLPPGAEQSAADAEDRPSTAGDAFASGATARSRAEEMMAAPHPAEPTRDVPEGARTAAAPQVEQAPRGDARHGESAAQSRGPQRRLRGRAQGVEVARRLERERSFDGAPEGTAAPEPATERARAPQQHEAAQDAPPPTGRPSLRERRAQRRPHAAPWDLPMPLDSADPEETGSGDESTAAGSAGVADPPGSEGARPASTPETETERRAAAATGNGSAYPDPSGAAQRGTAAPSEPTASGAAADRREVGVAGGADSHGDRHGRAEGAGARGGDGAVSGAEAATVSSSEPREAAAADAPNASVRGRSDVRPAAAADRRGVAADSGDDGRGTGSGEVEGAGVRGGGNGVVSEAESAPVSGSERRDIAAVEGETAGSGSGAARQDAYGTEAHAAPAKPQATGAASNGQGETDKPALQLDHGTGEHESLSDVARTDSVPAQQAEAGAEGGGGRAPASEPRSGAADDSTAVGERGRGSAADAGDSGTAEPQGASADSAPSPGKPALQLDHGTGEHESMSEVTRVVSAPPEGGSQRTQRQDPDAEAEKDTSRSGHPTAEQGAPSNAADGAAAASRDASPDAEAASRAAGETDASAAVAGTAAPVPADSAAGADASRGDAEPHGGADTGASPSAADTRADSPAPAPASGITDAVNAPEADDRPAERPSHEDDSHRGGSDDRLAVLDKYLSHADTPPPRQPRFAEAGGESPRRPVAWFTDAPEATGTADQRREAESRPEDRAGVDEPRGNVDQRPGAEASPASEPPGTALWPEEDGRDTARRRAGENTSGEHGQESAASDALQNRDGADEAPQRPAEAHQSGTDAGEPGADAGAGHPQAVEPFDGVPAPVAARNEGRSADPAERGAVPSAASTAAARDTDSASYTRDHDGGRERADVEGAADGSADTSTREGAVTPETASSAADDGRGPAVRAEYPLQGEAEHDAASSSAASSTYVADDRDAALRDSQAASASAASPESAASASSGDPAPASAERRAGRAEVAPSVVVPGKPPLELDHGTGEHESFGQVDAPHRRTTAADLEAAEAAAIRARRNRAQHGDAPAQHSDGAAEHGSAEHSTAEHSADQRGDRRSAESRADEAAKAGAAASTEQGDDRSDRLSRAIRANPADDSAPAAAEQRGDAAASAPTSSAAPAERRSAADHADPRGGEPPEGRGSAAEHRDGTDPATGTDTAAAPRRPIRSAPAASVDDGVFARVAQNARRISHLFGQTPPGTAPEPAPRVEPAASAADDSAEPPAPQVGGRPAERHAPASDQAAPAAPGADATAPDGADPDADKPELQLDHGTGEQQGLRRPTSGTPSQRVRPAPAAPSSTSTGTSGSADSGATRGWRRLARVVTGGSPAAAKSDLPAGDIERLRTPLRGPRNVVVLGCTGGAGQTVTTLMLGHTLAAHRDERVVAVDVNPGGGGLSRRVRTESPETLTSLLANADAVHGYMGMRRYTSRTATGLEVVATLDDPYVQTLDDRDYAGLAGLLERFYEVTVLDPAATGVARALPVADGMVLVAPASEDAARAVAMTFEWLDGHGYAALRSTAVVVINGVSKRSLADVDAAEQVARGRCRAIVRVPWDDHLAAGKVVDVNALRATTRRAHAALGGVLVHGLDGSAPSGPTSPGGGQRQASEARR